MNGISTRNLILQESGMLVIMQEIVNKLCPRVAADGTCVPCRAKPLMLQPVNQATRFGGQGIDRMKQGSRVGASVVALLIGV